MESLNRLRRTASRILAASAIQVFPGTLLVEGREHLSGFYYDFIFPFKFRKEFLPLIEEKMRQIIKSAQPIKTLEMIPENAAEYLEHLKQPLRAEMACIEPEGLLQLFQIEGFVDHCPGPFLENVDEVVAFRLHDVTEMEEQTVRIWGVSFFDRQELKDYFRGNSKKQLPKDHIQIGKELDLFSSFETENGRYWKWHPKGEIIREAFIQYWKKAHEEQKFQFFNTPMQVPFSKVEITKAHFEYFLSQKTPEFPFRIAELSYFTQEDPKKTYAGLLDSPGYFSDLAHIFCMEEFLEEECISSLQFMRKFSKISNLEKKWILYPSSHGKKATLFWERQVAALKKALDVVEIDYQIDVERKQASGPELHLLIKDGMGRFWSGCSLKLECEETQKIGFQGSLIVRSLYCSIGRWAALLLEQDQGKLPFWLSLNENEIC